MKKDKQTQGAYTQSLLNKNAHNQNFVFKSVPHGFEEITHTLFVSVVIIPTPQQRHNIDNNSYFYYSSTTIMIYELRRGAPVQIPREVSTRPSQHFTLLFRPPSYLEMAVENALPGVSSKEPLRVMSVGSSVGAEADSVLAICNQDERISKVAMTCIDISAKALACARQGTYIVSSNPQMPLDAAKELAEGLQKVGFGIQAPNFIHGNPKFFANSAPVRQGNTISFMEHDILQPINAIANVVLANNVLYYLRSSDATEALNNCAQMVGEGGVLSIGDKEDQDEKMVRGYRHERTYREWLEEAGSHLAHNQGFQAVPNVVNDHPPFMFIRE